MDRKSQYVFSTVLGLFLYDTSTKLWNTYQINSAKLNNIISIKNSVRKKKKTKFLFFPLEYTCIFVPCANNFLLGYSFFTIGINQFVETVTLTDRKNKISFTL